MAFGGPLLPSFILTTMCHPQDHAHAWLQPRKTPHQRSSAAALQRQRRPMLQPTAFRPRQLQSRPPFKTSGRGRGYYRRQRLIRLWLLASASWQHLAGSLGISGGADAVRNHSFSEFRLQPLIAGAGVLVTSCVVCVIEALNNAARPRSFPPEESGAKANATNREVRRRAAEPGALNGCSKNLS